MSAQVVQKHEVSDNLGSVNDQNRMVVPTPTKASFWDVYLLGINLHCNNAALLLCNLFLLITNFF